jgi:hypothetical protein
MKKTLLIALVAFATVLAVSCKEKEVEPEDNTLKLPGTSWSFNLNTTLYGSNVLLNDTLNILDDKTYDRDFDISASGFQKEMHASSGYTWDGTYLTLLDSVGQPTSIVLTYRESDSVFFRNAGDDADMAQIFALMGISEVVYKRIK